MSTTTVSETIAHVFRGGRDVVQNPYPLFAAVREAGALHRAPALGPFPAAHVTRYDDLYQALRDQRFSSERALGEVAIPGGAEPPTPEDGAALAASMRTLTLSMLTKDPPDHTRLRKLVAKAFTPRIVGRQAGMIQSIIDDLLSEAERHDTVDFMQALATPLPALVIAALMGVPQEDWPKFKSWSDGGITFDPSAFWERTRKSAQLDAYFRDLIQRRSKEPGEDLISALIRARDEADALTEDEMVAQCQVILTAGHETTTVALGSAMALLAKQPEVWALMREQPEVVPTVVEECLRLESPFQFNARIAKQDMEVAGEPIRAGEYVWFWVAGANRDPRQFANPDQIDPYRDESRHLSHLAFGGGIHYCLGAALAQLEMRLALTTLTQRYPNATVVEQEPQWRDNIALRGLESLAIRLGQRANG